MGLVPFTIKEQLLSKANHTCANHTRAFADWRHDNNIVLQRSHCSMPWWNNGLLRQLPNSVCSVQLPLSCAFFAIVKCSPPA